jgi:hypothetical protein
VLVRLPSGRFVAYSAVYSFPRRLAAQVALREGRAFVGRVRFVADQDYPPVETLLAQRLDR